MFSILSNKFVLFILFKQVRRNVIDVSYHIAQYKQIIQDLRNQVQLLRDQRDDLEIRLTTTNEARFSRLSSMFKLINKTMEIEPYILSAIKMSYFLHPLKFWSSSREKNYLNRK